MLPLKPNERSYFIMAEVKNKEEVKETAKKEDILPADSDFDLVDYRAPQLGYKDKSDVIVSVNGKVFQIQRGKDVKIPRYVKEALDNAERQNEYAANYIEQKENERSNIIATI